MTPACVAYYRVAARRRLPKVLFDYIDGGSYAEATLAANVDDLRAVTLRQRVLRDVSHLSMATEVFGQRLSMPVVLAACRSWGMYRTARRVRGGPRGQGGGRTVQPLHRWSLHHR